MMLALFLSLAARPCPLPVGDPVEEWTEDVLHLVSEIARLHPDPYFGCPQEEFEAGVDTFLGRIEADGARHGCVELMRLVALLSRAGRDGHSVVWPMQAHYLPLQLYRFEGGWFVVDAEPAEHARIGARVVSIGGVPVEEVCNRLASLLTRDNDWNLRLKLGGALICADLLAGVGVVPDPTRVELELAREGASAAAVLPAGAKHIHQLWGRPELPARAGATWLEGRDQTWRLVVLEAERALYVQYNEVRAQSTGGQLLADLGLEIVRTFAERGLERVLVDVRSNGGGDNTTFGPLIAALKTPAIDREGVLFGLIGRGTFSAAGNFVAALERDTRAILVGEPTGGGPNQFGDAQTVPLANHPDVLVRISTRYHQFGPSGDPRLAIEPRVAVPLTSQDYFAGRDPVLEAALAYRP